MLRFLALGPGSLVERIRTLDACRVRCCHCGRKMNWAVPELHYSVGLNGFNCGCWRDPVD
jgi:hypothetical protein